ncbi:hypothetical protein CHU_1882 [Cytophaga hutchinsonii ATCC 33406]|uniref:Uncharacterized protein n=2 Tax=Cytophaga hutchinsonii TaxID=985 RepID=A0A6N4SS73_CYTH3|nr:hypothetical protein CHU_1882 [Cytophaga hutchinsonii ATCC 33406]
MANRIFCISFTKNINNMTTKLVYLIRLRNSNQTSVKVGFSCQTEESNYTRSVEMDTTGMKMSDVLNALNHQLTLKTVV